MTELTTPTFTLARARKAIVAGAGAGAAAVMAAALGTPDRPGYFADGKVDGTEVASAVAVFFTSLVVVGYATYRVANAEPTHASPDVATAAAVQQIANLQIPALTADDFAAVSPDAPTDSDQPAPGASAAGTPPVTASRPEHRAEG